MIVTKDRVISIDYTVTDKKNQLIDTTSSSGPLMYLHGHKNIIPGLEQALEGKIEGDRFHIIIPTADAYGEWDANLLIQVPREKIEIDGDIEMGMQFEAETSDGSHALTVTEIAGNTITLDGNHPLAGKDLIFDVTVTEVREGTPEEVAQGHIHSPYGCSCGNGDENCETCGY